MQLWHGDQDQTLNFHNFGEEIKQWTNVLGVSETPTTTEQNAPQSGWTRTRYADSTGVVRVEAVLEAGMPHNLTVLSNEAVRFFGLDGAVDPGGFAGSGAGATGGAGVGGASGSGSGSVGAAGRGTAGTGGMSADAGSPSVGFAGGAAGAAGVGATAGTGA